MRIELLHEVGSTNDYIRRYLQDGEDVIVCAERQTGGKGTKGRSFASEQGGVYLSALTFHRDLPAERAFCVMTHAAVAACRTAHEFGIDAEIKWCNDLLVNGKKLCGILIENILSEGRVQASIVGIGMNVANDLSGLTDIAARFSDFLDPPPTVQAVREKLIENYLKSDTFGDYLGYVCFLGREITVCEGERIFRATAKRILSDGRLEVETEGKIRTLSAAEISLKI